MFGLPLFSSWENFGLGHGKLSLATMPVFVIDTLWVDIETCGGKDESSIKWKYIRNRERRVLDSLLCRFRFEYMLFKYIFRYIF